MALKTFLDHFDPFCKLHYLFGTFKMIWAAVPNLLFAPRSGVFSAFLLFFLKNCNGYLR